MNGRVAGQSIPQGTLRTPERALRNRMRGTAPFRRGPCRRTSTRHWPVPRPVRCLKTISGRYRSPTLQAKMLQFMGHHGFQTEGRSGRKPELTHGSSHPETYSSTSSALKTPVPSPLFSLETWNVKPETSSIPYPSEKKPLRRGGWAGAVAVFCLNDPSESLEGYLSLTEQHKGAHYVSHHVAQKTRCLDDYMDKLPLLFTPAIRISLSQLR